MEIPMRVPLLSFAALMVLVSATPSVSHPHDDPEIFDARGTLTKVDLARQFIEVDVVDNKTKVTRNQLFFVDPRVNIRAGKTRLRITDLRAGQRGQVSVMRLHEEGREDVERLVVFEIRLDVPS